MGALTIRLQDLEVEIRAAITEEQTRATRSNGEDAEQREYAELRGRVGNYVAAALELRNLDGAELEFNRANGLQGRSDGFRLEE